MKVGGFVILWSLLVIFLSGHSPEPYATIMRTMGLVGMAIGISISAYKYFREIKPEMEREKRERKEKRERAERDRIFQEKLKAEQERASGIILRRRLAERNPLHSGIHRMYSDQDYRCPICGAYVDRNAVRRFVGSDGLLMGDALCNACGKLYSTSVLFVQRGKTKLPEGVPTLTERLWVFQMMIMADYESGIIDAATRDAELEEAAEIERLNVKAEAKAKQQQADQQAQKQQQRDRVAQTARNLRHY